MEVTFNPKAAAHNPNARAPQTQSTPATTAPEGSDDSVAITLSPAAKQVLKAGASEYTGKSPAHMARQFIADSPVGASAAGADGPDLSGPFGQIVKTFAPGHNKEPEIVEEPGAVPEDGGDTTVVDGGDGTGTTGTTEAGDTTVVDGANGTVGTGTTEGGDTTVADGSDDTVGPILVVDEPDVTEVLDDSAPADGGVTEPESGIAGSGDAVASSGDDAPVDDGTSVDSGETVAVVDTGDLTDELLDLLDEGSEEVV